MYKSKSRQNAKLMVMAFNVSPSVIQGVGHYDLEHKLDEGNVLEGPLSVSI